MQEFTHPIELSDNELDLVAAGTGNSCGGGGGGRCCGGNEQIGLVNLNNVLNHNNVLSGNVVQVGIGNTVI